MTVCYCDRLPQVTSRTRVVFLQHPRERRVPVGTCRMAHLALPNSELHVGVDFSGHAGLERLVDSGTAAVLFPDDDAQPLEAGVPDLQTLVVIDGTWSQARKMVQRNPLLQRLPRVRFTPQRPGNYRIRREPEAHCLSTIEAVVEALEHLEGGQPELRRMLDAFTFMVDRQLEHAHSGGEPRRRRSRPRRAQTGPWPVPPDVLVVAEANAPVTGSSHPFEPELVQLAALRLRTGEWFEALARPEQPLSLGIPRHLDLPAQRLLDASPRAAAVRDFVSFLQPGEALATWGAATPTLLSRAGAPTFTWVDVRRAWRGRKQFTPGGVEDAARTVEAQGSAAVAQGRAGRRLASLHAVTVALSRSSP